MLRGVTEKKKKKVVSKESASVPSASFEKGDFFGGDALRRFSHCVGSTFLPELSASAGP